MQISKYLIILFLLTSISYGQTDNKVDIITFLNHLEDRLDIKFSYATDQIKTIKITENKEIKTPSEAVAYLNASTPFHFELLDDRYITVSIKNQAILICGTIVDASSQKSLMGATIIDSDANKGSITNQEGKFQLHVSNINTEVTISFLGYSDKIIPAGSLFKPDGDCPVIELELVDYSLSEVIVTQFLTTGLQKSIDDKTILNTEKFGILPGLTEPDILQTIQVLPGVESINESIANINVRGGTHDENLMLWDDIAMYHSGHFFGLISAYNPNLTHRVEVSKNGTSSEYGGGVSSTIKMYTKDEINPQFSGGAGINFLSADTFLEIPFNDKVAIHVSGRRSITDGLNTPTYDAYFQRSFQDSEIRETENTESIKSDSQFYFYDYSAKLLYNPSENHKIRASFISIDNALDYTESVQINAETQSRASTLTQKNIAFGGSWSAIWSDKLTSDVNAYFTRYDIDANDLNVETDQLLTQENEVLETGLKANLTYKPLKNIAILSGYQFIETGIRNATRVSNPLFNERRKDVLRSHSLFNEVTYKKNKTFIRIGGRASYFEKFEKFRIEPRLNLRQGFASNYALKLQGEFKYQTATQTIDFEDDFLGVENRRWILANDEDIPLVKSKQISMGIDYKKHNWFFDISGFYKIVDGITASNQGFQNQFQFIRTTGRYEVKGVEFIVNKTANKFSSWLTYTFSENLYEFSDLIPSQFPNNTDIKHSLTLAVNYDILANLKISLGGLWRSGSPYTQPKKNMQTEQDGNNRIVNYDIPNGENLEPFKRIDLSASYDFKLSNKVKAKLNLGVINILDHENILHRHYRVDTNDEDQALKIDRKSLGITPNAAFRVNF